MVRTAIALAAAALVFGCGGVHPLTSSSASAAVPWLPLPPDLTPIVAPSPKAVPVPPGTPACTPAELQPAVIGSNGATGHVLTFFAFSTRGAQACQVEGTPAVALLDAAGHDLGFQNRDPYFPNEVTGPALVNPGTAPTPGLGLKVGMAGLTIDWISQPEACPGEAPSKVAAARVDIAAVGTVTVAVPPEPDGYSCQGVGVGDLAEPPVEYEAPAAPPLPVATISAPARVKAGATLSFLVTLTNPTPHPIDLRANCPNYEEELFADIFHGSPPLGGKHLYRLNCQAAGVLIPGKPTWFAMQLPVAAGAAPGKYTLIFDLGYANATSKRAPSTTVVVA